MLACDDLWAFGGGTDEGFALAADLRFGAILSAAASALGRAFLQPKLNECIMIRIATRVTRNMFQCWTQDPVFARHVMDSE